MTSKATIRAWLDKGKADGATHVMIAWDTFDGPDGDYPIYVMPGDNAAERVAAFVNPRNADKLIEVYDLSMDLDKQLAEYRAWHV